MYRPDLGVTGDPFEVAPDPRLFHPEPAREALLAAMAANLRAGGGTLAVLGEDGLGKSMVVRVAARRCEMRSDVRLLPARGFIPCEAQTSFDDVVRACRGRAPVAALAEAETGAGAGEGRRRTAVLFLDDADRLVGDVVERIKAFQALYRHERGPFVLIVAGRTVPEGLAGATVQTLTPMASDDVRAMIDRRLRSAGQAATDLFMPEALDNVVRSSRGNPGRAITLCRGVLRLARREHAMPVLPELVDHVAHGLWPDEVPAPVLRPLPDIEALAPPEATFADAAAPAAPESRAAVPADDEPADSWDDNPDSWDDNPDRRRNLLPFRRRSKAQRADGPRRLLSGASLSVTVLLLAAAVAAVMLISGRVEPHDLGIPDAPATETDRSSGGSGKP